MKNDYERIVKEFYQTSIFGRTNFSAKGFNLKNALDLSIAKAYEDNKRVLSGVRETKITKQNVIDFVEPYFLDYFKNKPQNFDKWHEKVCDKLVEFYGKTGYLREKKGEKGTIGFTYGNAQKIVNMTFKYLFCIMTDNNMGIENYLEYFKDCHLTLDSYIITGLVDEYKNQGIKYLSWSRLDKKEYLNYQRVAKENWHLQRPLFIEEFDIWNSYKNNLKG